MKTISLRMAGAILTLLLSPLAAIAGDGGGSDGCGLGWQVTSKKSFLATTTRGTTNSVVPPTFGMTSGTIGCDTHSFARRDQQAVEFVASNKDPLLMDMAQGKGEYLQSLFQVMGCDISSKATPVEMYSTVRAHVKSNPELARSCTVI
jgi:hypothetical protein